MLLESVAEVSDEQILQDYMASNGNAPLPGITNKKEDGRRLPLFHHLSQHDDTMSIFQSAPQSIMIETLEYLRKEHGTIPRYLESIGFNASWQHRLRKSFNSSFSHL
eukprot:CAMPEP_0172441310 /NCGR_PEP_ID=MMETSP1065-20121228/1847_1 /TAXON_ID=265537 /ORGANISM="Amphiprora paludosa, Strain CCMP125" /LENGTH=106 /DNA_ID=CAMNT_0013190579 /DNA_START=30 /DNA_END=350 /DNA_ORIENTATION=-